MKVKILKVPENIKAYGGPTYRHSGNWTNNVVFINEGGLHSENPFEGVMVGVDNQGVPNLVEEGEVIFGDYVFSNRLKPTKKILADGGFSDKYVDWTFAKIAEDLQKESAERPIDFISNNTLEDMMSRLITFQEMVRDNKKSNSYKKGGLVNKFDGVSGPSLIGRYEGNNQSELSGLNLLREAKSNLDKQKALEALLMEAENNMRKDEILTKYGNLNNNFDFSLLNLNTEQDPFAVNLPEYVEVTEPNVKEKRIKKVKEFNIPEESERDIERAIMEETALLNEQANKHAAIISAKANREARDIVDSKLYKGAFDYLKGSKENSNENEKGNPFSSLGRYMPAVVNAFSTLYNASQKPDKLGYEHADNIMDYANNIPVATYDPIGGKVSADLIDPNYLLNQHLAERASLNKAIKENARTSSSANMSLASAAYNGQRNDADALLAINRENNARKMQAAQFNLGIDQANRQGAMSTQQLNINRGAQIANAAAQASNMKLGIDQFNLGQEQLHGQALSQGIGATANDIAGIATENYWANEIKDNPAFMEYIAMMNKAKNSSKCGGMLTRKRRK